MECHLVTLHTCILATVKTISTNAHQIRAFIWNRAKTQTYVILQCATTVQETTSALADQAQAEIEVIESFMPRQLDEAEVEAAIAGVIADIGAESVKDMGKAMSALREKYAGQMDFGRASASLKAQLAGK